MKQPQLLAERDGAGEMLPDLNRFRVSRLLAAASIYGLVALFVTYPLITQINTVIVGDDSGDAYSYVWSMWRAKQVAFDRSRALGHVALINHPVGLEDPATLATVGLQVMTLPCSLLLPPAPAYNALVLLTFILNGIAMYALCVEVTGNHAAGLVGGFIFAFSPHNVGQAMGGQLPQLVLHWAALYALFLHRTIQVPRWRNALISAVLLPFACLTHPTQITCIALPITVTILLRTLLDLKADFFTWRRCAFLALALALSASVIAPFLLSAFSVSPELGHRQPNPDPIEHSSDLLGFLTPSPHHPILRVLGWVPSFAEAIFPDKEALHEGLTYPGFLAVILALWGMIQQGWKARWWGVLALVTAVLSLGPVLRVGGQPITQAPMLNTARVPSTFGATVMFGIAVAASYGTAALFSQIGSRMSLSKWALPFLLLGIGFEFLVIWPFPINSAEVPSAIQWIAAHPGSGAILHLGMDQEQFDDRALYYQTVTRRPLVGGETQSATSKGSPWSQMLFGLIQVDPGTADVVPQPQKAERARWLRHFDVDYVVTHRSENGLMSSYGAIAEDLLEPPAYEDPHMAVFAVPGDALSPEGSYLYTFSSQGWRPPRHEERWLRWMNEEDGLLYLYSTREGTGGLRFAVDALSQLNLPTLRVSLNNERVDEFLVDDRTTYTTRLVTIREGMNVFHFHTSAECEDVEDSSSPCRLLVLDQVSFIARDGLSDRELSQVDFGNQLELRGWKLENTAVHPGDSLTVTLTWQSKVKLGRSHVVFVHLLSEDGELVAQRDLAPVGDVVSPSTWPEGATLALPMTIELPFDLPPGEYRLRTGVYLWPDLERLPVSDDVPGSQNNVAEIGTVRAVSR